MKRSVSASLPSDSKGKKLKEDDELIQRDEASSEENFLHESWYGRLKMEFKKPYFLKLKEFLKRQIEAGLKIFPPGQ